MNRISLRIGALCAATALTTGLCIGPAHAQSATPATPPLPHLAHATEGAATVHVWHAAAREAISRQRPNQQAALRILALLAGAQQRAADSFAEAPADDDAWQALFDTVSSTTLAGLVPAEADAFRRLADGLAATRRASNTAADVQRAQATGHRVAQDALARASTDGFDAAWTGSVPTDAHAWRSLLQPPRPPHLPALGRMKPLFLASGDAVRPVAPPAVGSAAFGRALAEVKRRVEFAEPSGVERAKRWEMVTGSLVAGFWDETALRLAAQQGLGGRATSRVLAASLGATLDANIACHDAKYTYWTPRPSQADPSLKPIVGLPNHPSYPSNHACDSGAAAEVLAAYFPERAEALRGMAREAGESRIDGGIHYRFDLDAGLAIGRAAAAAALSHLGPAATAVVGALPPR
jgi:membrane-associated phospholipid phosphatase